jgi:hypothetical protein
MAFKLGISLVSNIQLGNKMLITVDITGPASYSRTTGMVLTAASLGVGGFEFCDASLDTTNAFELNTQYNLGGSGNAVPSVIFRPYATATVTSGGQSQTVGTEAAASTNLSTFSFRVQLFCV